MTVEYLRAWEDGTWDTLRVDVPEAELEPIKVTDAGDDAETLTRWAGLNLRDQTCHRKVIMWAVFSIVSETGE